MNFISLFRKMLLPSQGDYGNDFNADFNSGGVSPTPAPPPPPTNPTIITGPAATGTGDIHTLQLFMAGDAYQGNPEMNVSVNGRQLWKNLPVTANHSLGQKEVFTIYGSWTTQPKVAIAFVNDLYGGTPQTDRNLYFLNATYDGVAVSVPSHSLDSNGTYQFTVP